ncbi:MAG: rod shape-determining protein [Rhodothermaceae bacterium]|nr:MAG: hypothetical protein D6746_15360 [Bacteroidota bacterium]GIV62123.1 MAG: rod shape-determining protein [Rhodothermaceae bacterium]
MPPKKKTKEAAEILYVGVDLGTSRSAVSASNGKRQWVESYVGWPRDFVSRKLLGKPVLFGEEALKNRMALTLVRPLEYGVIRDGTAREEEAIRELVHHLMDLAEAAEGMAIYAAVGVPAEALKVNKLAIRDAVREFADSLMVVSEPFAVAYGLGALNNAMIIDIGAGTVDFCVMHGTMPGEEDQRTLTTAGDFIDRQLYDRLTEKYPNARLSLPFVRKLKEEHGFVGETQGKVTIKVPVEGKLVEYDVTEDVRHACERILPPIVETTIDLISRYEPEFQEQLRRNIYLAGGGSQIRGITTALEEALREYGSFKVSTVEDPLFAGADGALALARDMPEEYWEEMS